MSRLFVHHPLFRLLSPLVSGTMVYVLILLFNNSADQVQEEFLDKEWFLCVGLSYLIQEFARVSLLLFARMKRPASEWVRLVIQVFFSILLCVGLVSIFMHLYYYSVLGFRPNPQELIIFNSIFSSITLIYISLYLSHQFLHKINSRRIKAELSIKAEVEEDFRQFKRGIHPALLFTSLESLIVLLHRNKNQADDLISHLSIVYRYILAERNTELVPFHTEYEMLQELIQLFNFLPFREIKISGPSKMDTWVVPGALLFTLEQVIRSTIAAPDAKLEVVIHENKQQIELTYQPHEKINSFLGLDQLIDIQKSYAIYSEQPIRIKTEGKQKTISLPKLNLL